jgi:hypothetical protein
MRSYFLLICLAITLLSGCATVSTTPVALAKESISATGGKIGVAMSKIPAPNTYFPGASCLLCIGVAEMAHNKLSAYVKTLPTQDLAAVKQAVFEQLKLRGANAVLITEDVNLTDLPANSATGENLPYRDFRALKAKYGIDRIFLISVDSFGVNRPYAAYVPTGVPIVELSGSANIVDLSTNTYNWYLPLRTQRTADGAWDEPPKFPGLSNAYYQVIELTKDAVLDPLKP